ncbi:MAG: Yip1 family protein [bacterium]
MKEIIERAKAILYKPKETWWIIKNETGTVQDLFVNYAAPLALIPAVSTLIGFVVIGIRMPSGSFARAPFMESLTGGILGYFFNLLGLLAAAWVINFLAPYFNSKQDFGAAVKLVIYSMTPVWLVGIFSLLPGIGVLQLFGFFGVYLLFLGLPAMLDTPIDKMAWFTTFIVIAWFLISLLLTIIVGGAVYGPMFLRMMSV